MKDKVVVVSGGNRGIGFGVVQAFAKLGYITIMGCRDLAQGKLLARALHEKGIEVTVIALDVTSQISVVKFRDAVLKLYGRIDVLINNAAIYLEGDASFLEIDEEILQTTLNVNVVGAWRMCNAISPTMLQQQYGRIVNISSGWGAMSEMAGNAAAYRLSKASLNALTKIVAAEMAGKGDIQVNAVCPGWVRTLMGGANAPTSINEAAEAIVWAATQSSDGPNGDFFRNKKKISW